MEEEILGVGSKVQHSKFGTGIIVDVGLTDYTVWIKHRGDVDIPHGDDRLEAIDALPNTGDTLTLKEVKTVINSIFHEWNVNQEVVELGDKWHGGKMLLQPESQNLKPKEIPVEIFFHKIVMLRDRVRVMEQKINSSKNMSDEEKVDLQQYITRIYGSLTTFNVLFKNKEDYFKGAGGKS